MPATAAPPLSTRAAKGSTWVGGNMPGARLGLILNLWIPFLFLLWDALHGNLGADPVNNALHTTGLVAITYLISSLAVTPLRMATGWTWIIQFRRSLGVYAFYYACAHLAIYFWWDRSHNLHSTVYEITHRYYLMIGFISLALMAPLWATSFNAAIQTMGPVWWKRLHRLAYIAAGLGCWHLYLQSKADKRRPEVYFALLGALLLWRVVAVVAKRVRTPAKAVAAAALQPARSSFWKGELKVVGMFRETESVRTFRLAPPDASPIPFDFRAGQFLNLALEIEGKRVSRSYTIASAPTRDHYVELTVKREESGHVSRFLHDMLMTGQAVSISAPSGRFTFDSGSSDSVLLLAGGVGITPAMSILRDLTDRSWPGKIDLVFSIRSPSDLIFDEELRYLANRHSNLHVHVTVSRDAGPEWKGLHGRITADLLKLCVPDVVDRPVFICGPDAMAMATRNELLGLGVSPERIHLESFTPAAAVAKDDGSRPDTEEKSGVEFDITFSRSGRSLSIGANKTILEAAEAADVSIDYQCRSGICGTCRCKLLSGRVKMGIRDALSETDEAAGYILACQAHPAENTIVEA